METGASVLVIEDDASTRSLIRANLIAHGHAVVEAATVAEAFRAWDRARPDVIVLDLGLPDRDGISVVRRVRREASTPILVVSARETEAQKVAALEAGADDYVTKPVGMAELQARIGALLRRAGGPASDGSGTLTLGPVRMDAMRRLVTVGDAPVDLTPREYELLRVFMSHPGRVVTTGRLLRAVWGTAYADEAHYVHVYVSRLRRKLAASNPDANVAALFVAEPGVGYRVQDADVEGLLSV